MPIASIADRLEPQRSVRPGRLSVLAMLLALLGCMLPAAASASTTTTSFFVSLPANVAVAPNDAADTVVLSTTLALKAGESRRIADRLGATLSSSDGAEVDNGIVCFNPAGMPAAQTSSGTNHPGSGAGELGLMESLLLQAPVTGTYTCQILARTSAGSRANYAMTAVKGGPPYTTSGTWLRISSADEVGAHAWSNHECNSPGTFPTCVYLGGSGAPREANVFTDRETWTATPDTTQVDVVGTFQITSCPYGTASCISSHWGDDGFFGLDRDHFASVQTYLQFNQLNPDGSVCRINQSNDDASPAGPNAGGGAYTITDSVHHLPVSYHLTAPVAATCNGSRRFALDLYVGWRDGNPIKLDNGGFNVIQHVRGSTTTSVPPVLGMPQAQAVTTINARGLKPVTVGSVMNPAPVGTVFVQNSPGGTVEPTGSEVDITISLGQTSVPDVTGLGESSATHAIIAAGLTVGKISSLANCVDPGLVELQNPRGGTQVTPGTSVSITIATCPNGGGGDGPPVHPK